MKRRWLLFVGMLLAVAAVGVGCAGQQRRDPGPIIEAASRCMQPCSQCVQCSAEVARQVMQARPEEQASGSPGGIEAEPGCQKTPGSQASEYTYAEYLLGWRLVEVEPDPVSCCRRE